MSQCCPGPSQRNEFKFWQEDSMSLRHFVCKMMRGVNGPWAPTQITRSQLQGLASLVLVLSFPAAGHNSCRIFGKNSSESFHFLPSEQRNREMQQHLWFNYLYHLCHLCFFCKKALTTQAFASFEEKYTIKGTWNEEISLDKQLQRNGALQSTKMQTNDRQSWKISVTPFWGLVGSEKMVAWDRIWESQGWHQHLLPEAGIGLETSLDRDKRKWKWKMERPISISDVFLKNIAKLSTSIYSFKPLKANAGLWLEVNKTLKITIDPGSSGGPLTQIC